MSPISSADADRDGTDTGTVTTLAVVSWLARDDARYDQFIGAISALAA
jgi:hypothetical protein